MRTDDFKDVGEFHNKFGLPVSGPNRAPAPIDHAAMMFRVKFMIEELSEICDGYGLTLDWTLTPAAIPAVGKGGCPKCGYDGEHYYDPANHNCQRQDLPKIADGLVDLVYVALGTAHFHGLPWGRLFGAVQRANMAKERAPADGTGSVRKSSLDVIKPKGWTPPDISGILIAAGWPGPELPLEKP